MSAEPIARVMRDLKLNRIRAADNSPEIKRLNDDTAELALWADVIDVTPVYNRWMASGGGTMLYEDHRACPPWENAFLCYENSLGNVTVMSTRALDIEEIDATGALSALIEKWESLAETHVIDWDRVKWVTHIALYAGGRSGDGTPVPTFGPLHCWRIAIYPDGEIADINWIQVNRDLPLQLWDNALMVWLDTMNMCNCVNVQIAEPERPRAERKRVTRTGFRVNEIHIRPISKSYRGKGRPLSAVPSGPLSSVRGHMVHYGPQYGRGLLFGKYSGRFWIPQHIRGSEAHGVSEQEYSVEP